MLFILKLCCNIWQATCDVIEEFAADGVVYLELRSTPRPIPSTGVTQRSYVETILKAIKDRTSVAESLQQYTVKNYYNSIYREFHISLLIHVTLLL